VPETGTGSAFPEMPTVCILAGGKGTRLGDLTREIPKPLIEVAGAPFLVHQLRLLARHGVRRVVCCVGYLGLQIEETLGNEVAGVELAYSYDGPGLDGTLGAIRRARRLLGDHFLILYGDTYLRIDYRAAYQSWLESAKPGLMTVLRNAGRWDTSNADYADGLVIAYNKSHPHPDMAYIDYGLGGLFADAIDAAGEDVADLSDLCTVLAAQGRLAGYEATERFFEIGTPAALRETHAFLIAHEGLR
jgi:NDP-sugar pyrophosphorylase family protein